MPTHPTPPAGGAARRLALLCVAATAALRLVAADNAATDATNDDVVRLPQFTVSSESADPYRATDAISSVRVRAALIDTPNSISVLTRDMLDEIGPTRLYDAVRYVAGVQDGRGIQFQDRIILRGFESYGRTVDNFSQINDADNYDEVLVDRIEITKGPNAILSPAGVPGGALNVITKSPLYTQRRSFSATIGRYDAQKATLDLAGPFSEGSPWAYRVIGSYQNTRRYWASDAKLKNYAFAPMLAYRISDRTNLTIKLVGQEHWIWREPAYILAGSVTAFTKEPYLAAGFKARSRNGIQPWSHVGTHTMDGTVQLTSALNDHVSMRAAFNSRYYYEDSMQEFFSTPSLTNRYNPMTGELTQDATWALDPVSNTYVATLSPYFNPAAIPVRGDDQDTRRWTHTLQNDYVIKYDLDGVTSQTVAGFAYATNTNRGRGRTGTLPAINLNNPDVLVTPVWGANDRDNRSNFKNWQLYVNQSVGLLENRLYLQASLLHYDTHTEAWNAMVANPTKNILDDAKNMWSASILGKPRENVSVYYSHSTNSSPTIANNQPLWRDGEQDEIGVKTEFFNQRLSINAAWFTINQTNVTVPNPERQINPSAPEQLISDLENDGYEIEIFGALTDELSIIATHADLNMRDSLGRPVRAVADTNTSILFGYRFRDEVLKGLSVNFGITFKGKTPGDTTSGNFTPLNVVKQQSFFIPAHQLTNLGVAYRKGDYLFRLQIDNVFDEKDYIQQAGGRFSGVGLSTAPGRNYRFTTTVDF